MKLILERGNNQETVIFEQPKSSIHIFKQPFYIKKWLSKYGQIPEGTKVQKNKKEDICYEKNYFFKYVYGDYINPPCIVCKQNIINIDKCELTYIQSVHIGGSNDKENIIPTCFTCHVKCDRKHMQDYIVEQDFDSLVIVFDNIHIKKYSGLDGLVKTKCSFCDMYENKQNIFLFKQFTKEKNGIQKYGFYFKCSNCISFDTQNKILLMTDEELKQYCGQQNNVIESQKIDYVLSELQKLLEYI